MVSLIAEYPALSWLVAGLVLLVAEILAPGFFMMWLGLAGIVVGTVTEFVPIAFAYQVVLFGVLALALIGVALGLRRRQTPSTLNSAESGLIGRSARVLSVGSGEIRVRLGDSDWSARLAPGTASPLPGDVLVVMGVAGTSVVVGARQ